jgi:large conductance mechanosensitive channel
MSFGADFRKFITRGNVVDLAVGVVIGAAFGKIVSSFVGDLLMPPIGLALGKVDFSSMFVALDGKSYATVAAAKAAGAPVLAYGMFINTIIEFLIIAFAVFLVVRAVQKVYKPEAPPPTKECAFCTSSIPVKAKRCPQCTSTLEEAKA